MSAPYSPPSPGGRGRRSRTEHKLPSITKQLPDMFPPTGTPPLTPDSTRNPWNSSSPSRQQKTRGSSYDSRKSSYQSSSSSGYHPPPTSMPSTGKDRRQYWDSGDEEEEDDDDDGEEQYADDMRGLEKPKLPSLKSLDLHSTDSDPWLSDYSTRNRNNVHPGRGTSATLQEHALSRQSMPYRGSRNDPLSTTSATFSVPHDSAPPPPPSSDRYQSGPGGYSPSPSSTHRHSDHASSQLIWESSSQAGGGAGSNPNGRKRRGNLPKESTNILNDWYNQHRAYPYPKDDEKQHLQAATGLSLSQISNWFINARRRRRPDSASSYRTPELLAQPPPPTSSGAHDPYARYDPRTLAPR
ncbi:MAG: hypothetical protein M1831_000041 [Alyxoria varia]|nr:MAG: hypothetical protein M1831_000041 [Alyxoria varia]